jgi:hypothetical protein
MPASGGKIRITFTRQAGQSFQESCGNPVAVRGNPLAHANVIVRPRRTLDDPHITGIEVMTSCPDGPSYPSIKVVLGQGHYPALVVRVGASVERYLEGCSLSDEMMLANLGWYWCSGVAREDSHTSGEED